MAKIIAVAIFLMGAICPWRIYGQVQIDTSYSPTEIVRDVLLGKRVQVSNVRYVGSKLAMAVFTDSSATPLIAKGLMLCTGKVFDAKGPNHRANTTYAIGTRGDRMLEHIAKGATYDAAYLEFDFVPEMESVVFNFFFGSEEYTEYVNTEFNDVFAFFISGPGYSGIKNLAVIPKSQAPITVNTVNHLYNRSNYIDNNPYDRLGHFQKDKLAKLYPDLLHNYEYDGFTTLLSAEARVRPGQTYHIKIGIADVSDGRYDSAVFLEANSFTSLPQDPAQRATLIAAEYGHVKRKFRPVTVGEDPLADVGGATETAVTEDPNGEDELRFLVNFDFNADALSPAEQGRLDSLWSTVLSRTTRKVIVQGHTDNVGDEDYNDRLSARRAAAVLAYLKSKGLPQSRISVQGFGYHKPASTNDTDAGRALNRRVEIGLE
jgi:outer membrane protein OmpA-like peptidoglycan-associated protein